jgi:hypothetical protein
MFSMGIGVSAAPCGAGASPIGLGPALSWRPHLPLLVPRGACRQHAVYHSPSPFTSAGSGEVLTEKLGLHAARPHAAHTGARRRDSRRSRPSAEHRVHRPAATVRYHAATVRYHTDRRRHGARVERVLASYPGYRAARLKPGVNALNFRHTSLLLTAHNEALARRVPGGIQAYCGGAQGTLRARKPYTPCRGTPWR